MRSILKIAVAASLAVPAAAAMTGDSVQMTAGRWKESYVPVEVTVGGKPMPASLVQTLAKEKFSCMTAELAADPRRYFTESSGSCSEATGTVANGSIGFQAVCTKEDRPPMTMNVTGTYERNSYRTALHAEADMQGKPFVMRGTIEGKFVGPCQGDEER